MAFTLPRLPMGGLTGSSPEQQQIWWQQIVEALEDQENAQNAVLTDLETVTTNLSAVTANLTTVTADLAAAIADIQAVQNSDKLTASYVIPAAVLSADDAGTDATITIDNHVRRYGDSTELSITGGTLTGLAFSTAYAVYYDDPTFSDTTPTYSSTTTPSNALNNYVTGRHYIGLITTPADGGASTSGGANPPGSGGDGSWNRFDI